jgi:cellulose synthase/poly-beta-1,6-N-acetylglucosamine synthase-like glycosyltransferase
MTLPEIGFWICLGLMIYIYAGYPAIVCLLAPILNRNVKKADIEPSITVVIAAFNEEREIRDTVVNKLAQDYPSDCLEVIVVSDGSTDRTDEIVRGLAERNEGRLRLLRQEPRQGKTQALNLALRHTSRDLVVFADANSIYAPNALRALVRSFADTSVGYVTGQMVYTNPAGAGMGEGAGTYMSYENRLRALETKLGSIVGVDGGIDAIRRELYVPMHPDQLPDFVLPLSVVEEDRRVVYEPEAVVSEPGLANAKDEFRMRVRVSLRALWGLYDKRSLLNPFRYPLFAWQLISHKVLRYVAFLPLAGVLLFNAPAVGQHPFYAGFLALQLAAYAFAALGHSLRRLPATASKLLVPYYFVVLNAACVIAFWKFLTGQKMVVWTPRRGE